MNRPAPFTQVSLKRALAVAEKAGKQLVVRPDGCMVFEDKPEVQTPPDLKPPPERKWVL